MKSQLTLTTLLLCGLLSACKTSGTTAKTNQNDLDTAPPKSTALNVTTALAQRGLLRVERNVSATISAQQDSQVAAQSGGTVKAILVQEGQQVSAGAAIIQLDDTQPRQALENAKLQLRQAEISLNQAKTTSTQASSSLSASVTSAQAALAQAQQSAQSAENLYKLGGSSLSDVQAARSQLAQAQSTLAQAQQNLAQNGQSAQNSVPLQQVQVDTARTAVTQAEENLSRTIVRAPFAGTVAALNVHEGEFAAQGSAVFRLVDPGSLRAKFNVPAADALALRNGAALNISYGGQSFKATVLDSAGIAGTDRLVPITASVQAPTGLPIGAAAQAHYSTTLGQGILVPSSAIQSGSTGNVVYLVKDNKAQRLPVTVVAESGGQVALSSPGGGLQDGVSVINPVPASLQDGSAVQVQSSPSRATATPEASGNKP